MKNTDWIEIDDDDCVFELVDKDMSAFDHMCAAMLAAYAEMDSEKFRELMARQLALLGPSASIVDLVSALAQHGVAQPRSLSLNEQIVRFNNNNQDYERRKAWARTMRTMNPSYSM